MGEFGVYCSRLGYGYIWGTSSPGGLDGKESVCNSGDPGSTPGLGRFDPWVLPKTLLYTKKFHDSPGIYKLILKTTIISIFLVAELNPWAKL